MRFYTRKGKPGGFAGLLRVFQATLRLAASSFCKCPHRFKDSFVVTKEFFQIPAWIDVELQKPGTRQLKLTTKALRTSPKAISP